VIAAALLLSTCLAAAPPVPAAEVAPEAVGRDRRLAQEEWEDLPYDEEEEGRARLLLSAWGGEALDAGGAGRGSTLLGGEVAWAFDPLDLGVAGYGYRKLVDAEREWTPVLLLRLTQRFRTRRGVDAAFSLGVGAGRPDDWMAWFQVALGVRVSLGPVFLGGELAFEQYDLLRLAAGLGVGF
jgi:hypothetical protein